MKTPLPLTLPARLRTEARRAKYKFHTLAQRLGVNVRYLYDLIERGVEPTNPEVRKKLFLPRHPRKEKPVPIPLPPAVRWWRRQSKGYRRSIIEAEFEKRKEQNG
jgi:hypothetical protein